METKKNIIETIKNTRFIFGTALTIGNEILDMNVSNKLLNAVWDEGVRVFDTSNNYGNGNAESYLGHFLSTKKRNDFLILSKVGWPGEESPFHKGLSNESILFSLYDSLDRLSLTYIDVYFAHRFDPTIPLIDIIISFNNLIKENRILSWGTSEWPLSALIDTIKLCEINKLIPPIAEQFVFSYLIDKNEISGKRKLLQDYGMITIGYSPLAQGLLTGKYNYGIPKNSRINKSTKIGYRKTEEMLFENKQRLSIYFKLCDNQKLDYIQTALCWVKLKNVIPIVGFSTIEQLSNIINYSSEFCKSIAWSEFDD